MGGREPDRQLLREGRRTLPGQGVSLCRTAWLACNESLRWGTAWSAVAEERSRAKLDDAQCTLAHFGSATPHQAISRRPSRYLLGASMGCKSFSWSCLGQVFIASSTYQQGEKCVRSARALVPCGRSGVAPGRTNTFTILDCPSWRCSVGLALNRQRTSDH